MLLNEMEIFYYVVEFQSFSKAAERLQVSKSFISKRITKLEQKIKTRLLTRDTRKLTLTEAGKNFYLHCANVVKEAQEGYAIVKESQGKPAGLLRITVPVALGLNLLGPILDDFLVRYPEVTIEVQLENRVVDIIKEGFDLALRATKLESSNLITQKIYSGKNILCGHSSYYKNHGKPISLEDLEKHNIASHSHFKKLKHMTLIKNNEEIIFYLSGNFISNSLDLIKEMVLNGSCIAILPEFMVCNEIKNNQLETCLTDYQFPKINVYAIYPERELISPKVKAFIMLLKNFLILKH